MGLTNEELRRKIDRVVSSNFTDTELLKQNIEEIVEQVNIYHQELVYQNQELLRANMELQMLKEKYQALFSDAPAGYVIYNQYDQIIEANTTFCVRAGVSPAYITKHKVNEFIAPIYQDAFYFMKNKLFDGSKREVMEAQIVGNDRIYEVSMISKKFNQAAYGGEDIICSILTDITEMKHQQDEILKMSYHDAMTGLYNRRYYFQVMEELNKSNQLPISMATIDLDGLKIINDTLGHEFGDQAILTVCDILKKGADENYILIRTGGDEIVALAPSTSEEKLKRYLRSCKMEIIHHTIEGIPLSISYGVASKNNLETNMQSVAALSEDLMYSTKILQSPKQKSMIVQTMARRLFDRQHYIREHSFRVAELAAEFGRYINLPDKKVKALEQLGYIHDIGMIAIGDVPLQLEEELSEREHMDILRHPQVGNRIVRSMFGFEEVATAILYHHENWDGSGYPYGISGEHIPYLARVISIVDNYDWYIRVKEAKGETVTLEEMQEKYLKESTQKFDPILVTMFLSFMKYKFNNKKK